MAKQSVGVLFSAWLVGLIWDENVATVLLLFGNHSLEVKRKIEIIYLGLTMPSNKGKKFL